MTDETNRTTAAPPMHPDHDRDRDYARARRAYTVPPNMTFSSAGPYVRPEAGGSNA